MERTLVALVAGAMAVLAGPAVGCGALAEARAAWDARDAARLEALEERFRNDASCGRGGLLDRLMQNLAILRTAEGDAAWKRGDAATAEAHWRQALAKSPVHWPARERLGQLAEERKHWDEAQREYEMALLAFELLTPGDRDARKADIARVAARAQDARLLSAGYVPPPRDGRNQPAGLWSETLRGFTPRARPVPIRFDTNSSALAGDDLAHARDLLAFVMANPGQRVRIIGHADERGGDAHNRALSEARAQAVADFLVSQGFRGPIEIEGKGEADPYRPNRPRESYSDAELWRLDRRVEFETAG